METHHGVRAACSHVAVGLLICVTSLPGIAHAAPLVIEEVARIANPDPSYTKFGSNVAIDGDSIIVVGDRLSAGSTEIDQAAFLFQRNSAGKWVFVRKLVEDTQPVVGGYFAMNVAMSGGVAAVQHGALDIFERTASGWIKSPGGSGNAGPDLAVADGRILAASVDMNPATGTCWGVGNLYEKQASGTWTRTHQFFAFDRGDFCDDESRGGSLDLSGDRVILGGSGHVYIYQRNLNGSWPATPTSIVDVAGAVAIDGSNAIVSASPNLAPVTGPYALALNDGTWAVTTNLNRPDRVIVGQSGGIDLVNGFAAVGYHGSTSIFQRAPNGLYDYVAKLVASDTSSTRGVESDVAMSARRVVTGGTNAAYVFEIPTDLSQPGTSQDDFEDRNAFNWTPLAGSTFSVVSSGGSFVFRQTSVAGAAGAVLTAMDQINQAIEADVIPRSFAPGGAEGWFGLLVRQADPGNYYYLTMRSTNSVSLRKLENGVIHVLANATLPVTLNRTYKLRLEAIGTQIRGYVDGQLRVQARDTTHRHGGAGLRMFKAAADHDNVVITSNPRLIIFSDDFEFSHFPQRWFTRLGTWDQVPDSHVFAQTSLGNGRVTTDVSAEDQIIQVRARATAYASGTGDKWFGIVARLQNDQQFYYVTVRNNNTVSLRKLVNGQIIVLDSAPLTVSLNTWYTLRLEAVGNFPASSLRDTSLRVYVNGRFLLEAHDTNFPEGTYGLATSKAAAQFDDFVVAQP
jgi:hypothetical protein